MANTPFTRRQNISPDFEKSIGFVHHAETIGSARTYEDYVTALKLMTHYVNSNSGPFSVPKGKGVIVAERVESEDTNVMEKDTPAPAVKPPREEGAPPEGRKDRRNKRIIRAVRNALFNDYFPSIISAIGADSIEKFLRASMEDYVFHVMGLRQSEVKKFVEELVRMEVAKSMGDKRVVGTNSSGVIIRDAITALVKEEVRKTVEEHLDLTITASVKGGFPAKRLRRINMGTEEE